MATNPIPGLVIDRPTVLNLDDVGTIPTGSNAVAGLTVKECGVGALRQTWLTFSSVPITVTRTGAANASAGQKVYTLPAGMVQVLGVAGSLAVTGFGSGSVTIAYGIGSAVAAADATLTSTEQDIANSATSSALTSGAGTLTYKQACSAITGTGVMDGTSAAKDVYVNFATANDIVAGGTAYLTGTIVLTYVNCGKTS